ncbi:MAG: flagellar hook capping family protein [Alphaproteobacteria bacterium]|nr:flagellar hook capping family protein [Alphaproteobacteria bacterium]MCB9974104.1 flagellar hook capping family protein [Rhodospirillales bacterium]
MASDVTVNKAVQSQLKTLNGNAQLAEDFDDFLRLLTTQLQNQDPLSPLDTNEFTSQLVQFAGVEQQINMNQKLNDLVSLGIGTSFSGALSYVGLDVSYLSSELNFDGSTPVKIDYAIDGVPKEAAVNIYDGTGALVFSQEINGSEGSNSFTWTGAHKGGGLVDPGTYEVRIDAVDDLDAPLSTSTVVSGHVRGIETQNGQTFLLIGDRAVAIGSIINASEPQSGGSTA